MDRIKSGETERIILDALDTNKAGVTGATITIKIVRSTDGFFWNGTAYQSGVTTVSPTAVDATNLPGKYYYDFTPTGTGYSAAITAATSTGSVVNFPQVGAVFVGGYPDSIDATITSRASATDYTSGRAAKLDNLDATISSRSTYSGGAVASVTGNVGGNVVGSVGSVTGAVGSVTANVTVGTIVTSVLSQIADRILRRSYVSAKGSSDGDTLSGRSLLGAIAKLTNRARIDSANSLVKIYHEDDTTEFYNQTITTDANALPITDLDSN